MNYCSKPKRKSADVHKHSNVDVTKLTVAEQVVVLQRRVTDLEKRSGWLSLRHRLFYKEVSFQ